MNLKKWTASGHLKTHKTSKKEIENLLAIVKRDLNDSKVAASSADARFISAYNAALKRGVLINSI